MELLSGAQLSNLFKGSAEEWSQLTHNNDYEHWMFEMIIV